MKNLLETKIIVILFLSIISACRNSSEGFESKHLNSAIHQVELGNEVEWLVILPGLGCKGCIQEAEYFMKENVGKKNIYFVLTQMESLKLLQQKIGIEIAKYENVLIDRGNVFLVPTDNSIYPCIVKINNGKIEDYEFQSPQNGSAFLRLEEQL